MTHTVQCVARTHRQVREIVAGLQNADIPLADITVSHPDVSAWDGRGQRKTLAPEGAATGAAFGACSGFAWLVLAWLGIVPSPGLEQVLADQPTLTVVCGTSLGSVVGSLIGGICAQLLRKGAPPSDARNQQSYRISVAAKNEETAARARHIFVVAEAETTESTPGAPVLSRA